MKKIVSSFLAVTLAVGLMTAASFASEKKLTVSDIKEKSEATVKVDGEKMYGFTDGSWVSFGEQDFTNVKSVRLNVKENYMIAHSGEAFRLYIDDPLTGKCIGYAVTREENEEPTYIGANIEGVTGKHVLYLKQNYSHSDNLYVYDVVLSSEEWNDPKAVTPVPDSKIVDTYSDTWTGTNAYGVKLADYEETGDVKDGNHEVGMFYHDWHLHNTKAYIAEDIINEYPEAKDNYFHDAWPSSGPAWWAEPVYGFYDDTDYWHYRKAAELLSAAGVDVIFLDYTNGDSTYVKGLDVMLKAYHDAREDGVDVPKISCYLQMGGTNENKWRMLKAVYFNLCYNEYYKDLWYYWDGKPMMIQTDYMSDVKAVQAGDTEEKALADELMNFFTFRQSGSRYTPVQETGYLHWLVNYPQPEFGFTDNGRVELMNVGMAINESYLYGETRVGVFSEEYTKGKAYTEAFGEDYREEAVHEGYFFREQASRVLDIDPEFCFVNGWNEWNTARGNNYYGVSNAFIDLYNDAKSRDFEPSKGELKDDYYQLLVDFIRKYKGVRKAPVASGEVTIDIAGSYSQWNGVSPEYINYYGGYERNAKGYKDYDTGENYVYTTEVINSISRAKVARDAEYVYFYVECDNDIVKKDENSLNIYINSDRNYATGWEGYDYVIANGKVMAFENNDFSSLGVVGTSAYEVSGKVMTLKVPREMIGYNSEFEFKWIDNIDVKGDLMLFYTEGNAAPVGRYNYLYTENEQTALSNAERALLTETSVLRAGSQKMVVNGAKMNVYDKDIRVTCFEENGTLYIPMSAAEEILGNGKAKVYYDYQRNRIYLKNHRLTDETEIDAHWAVNDLGSLEMKVDGKLAYTQNTAISQNGVIYIPATMLETAFGYTVRSMGDGAYAIGKDCISESGVNAALAHLN